MMLANLFRSAVSLVVSAAANELRKPENQEKLAAVAQQAAAKLRDPETGKQIASITGTGARALGRAIGNFKNRS